jgi:hypothetical protein
VWTESNVAAIWYNSIVRKTGGLKDTVIDFEITATELVMINLPLETSAILSKGNQSV